VSSVWRPYSGGTSGTSSFSSITYTFRGCRAEVEAYVGTRARVDRAFEVEEEVMTDAESSGCSRNFTSSG
jgi:hypothetical protein